nr:CrcB family protein [Alistipes shahii]
MNFSPWAWEAPPEASSAICSPSGCSEGTRYWVFRPERSRSTPRDLLIGILLETTNSAAAGWLLIAGFCGGFTTFSTFSADAVRLLRAGDYGPATAYIALSVAVCIAFAALGMWIGAQIARN